MMQEMGLRAEGKTAMFVAVDGSRAGIVAVADPIKDNTEQTIPCWAAI